MNFLFLKMKLYNKSRSWDRNSRSERRNSGVTIGNAQQRAKKEQRMRKKIK